MERVLREKGSRDFASSSHVAQGRFMRNAAQSDISSRIDNSPRMTAQRKKLQGMFGGAAQLHGVEDDVLQGKFDTAQRVEDEEEPLQGKLDTAQLQEEDEEEPLQGRFVAQREEADEEEPVQGKFEAAQLQDTEEEEPLQGRFGGEACVQREEEAPRPNNTGLPDNLKSGVENLSGMSMDNVKVHYNSSRPAQLNALAYTQGSDIHVAPGQERHLPHEAWHVVQQAQGRVQPTTQLKGGVPVNDDAGLEHEADVMGGEALQLQSSDVNKQLTDSKPTNLMTCQLASSVECTTESYSYGKGKSEIVGKSMLANLDPDSPIHGSAPGDGEQEGLMSYLKDKKDFKSMKRGHLMNGQLGGPGIAANLHPITTQANNWHQLHVENHVKKAISNKVGVVYRVDVNSEYNADGATNAMAEFKCQSWVWTPKDNIIDLVKPEPFASATITSKPEAGSTGSAAITENVEEKFRFLTKDLPDGWGEKGKGLSEWSGKVPPHFKSK